MCLDVQDGSLETLGKVLLQDTFTVWDPKHILKKGKERHLFLFEQALLLCKEIKVENLLMDSSDFYES